MFMVWRVVNCFHGGNLKVLVISFYHEQIENNTFKLLQMFLT